MNQNYIEHVLDVGKDLGVKGLMNEVEDGKLEKVCQKMVNKTKNQIINWFHLLNNKITFFSRNFF